MILKRMTDLCKKRRKVIIVSTKEGKFLSNGVVMARTNDEWGLEDYFIMLEDSPEEYHTSVIDCTDTDEVTQEAEPLWYQIVIDKAELQPFKVDDKKIIYIMTKYLKVFDDAVGFEFCTRGYFENALKVLGDFGTLGYIFPVKIEQGRLLEFSKEIYDGAAYAYESGFMALEEQESMF